MKQTLSARLLRSLARPRSAPQEIWDQQLRGFGCRASKQGTVSFFAMRRPRGSARSVRIKVGDFPAMSLSDARLRARALLREMQDGVDPRARKAAEARAEVAKQARSFSAVAELFIARHVATKRTARTIEQLSGASSFHVGVSDPSPMSVAPTSLRWSTRSSIADIPKPPA